MVTIVVLIILAVISINAVLGEDGLIKQAEKGAAFQANAEAEDETALGIFEQYIANAMAGTTNPPEAGITLEQAKEDSMLDKTKNTELTIGDDTVWIPAGFKVHEDTAETVDEGIVITDGTNEFVWVPVDETSFNEMFETVESELALSGSTGVTSSYYSNLRGSSAWANATVTNGTYTSTSTKREPDLITSKDDDSNAVKAGYENLAKMAQEFVDDYRNMRASIEKYNGFYIGRYELTGTVENPTVKSGVVLTADSSQAGSWHGLYKACKDVKKNNEYVTSTMIWGCQYDETINWLKNTKFKGNESAVDSDSTSWGNYRYASVKASDGVTEIKANNAIKMLETGITTYTMANKIYDLAGNCYEWTQEALNTGIRIVRGRWMVKFRI